MKPISQLKLAQGNSTSSQVLESMIKLFSNSRRHLRGPYYSRSPGNGRKNQTSDEGATRKNAISACASGALQILAPLPTVHRAAVDKLNMAAYYIYGDYSFIGVSESRGRLALLKVAKAALAS